MKWRTGIGLLGSLTLALAMSAPPALAADHQDGPRTTNDPAADINDVFAWTSSDGTKVNLAMTLYPAAGADAAFSNAVSYVFHTRSVGSYTAAAAAPTTDLICQFDASGNAQCWLGATDYLSATAAQIGAATGVTSQKGMFTLFAGKRADPFFFNLAGFKADLTYIQTNLSGFGQVIVNGCPVFSKGGATAEAVRTNLVSQLSHAAPATPAQFPGTGAPTDHFAGFNALAIVAQVNKSALTSGGALVAVWGATYTR